jgi:DNA (cytosine-5)-methyltransferase 1
MAEEVDGLLEHLSYKEATQFLYAGCEMDQTESSTYLKVSQALKDSRSLLQEARVQFPMLKALANAHEVVREETLSRIRGGATIGARDVNAIQRSFRRNRQTDPEWSVKQQFQRSAKLARRRAANAVADVDLGAAEILRLLGTYRPKRMPPAEREDIRAAIREQAQALLPLFVAAYGSHEGSLEDILALPDVGSTRSLPLAHAAIIALSQDRFDGDYGFALDNSSLERQWATHFQECLQPITSAIAPITFDILPAPQAPLTRLPNQKLSVVELCAGAGGMSLGLENAGFHPLALFEFDKHAAASLRLNRPLWNVIEGDIRDVDFTPFRSHGVDLLVGGLPCQPYSVDGKGLGKDDPRDLLLDGARAVREMQPRAFVFENVAGLLHARHADHLGSFLRQLKKAGYSVQIVRMEAEGYGVAQERTRMLFVGMRSDKMAAFRAPPTFPKWRSNLGDVLEDLMAANGWSGAKAWADALRNQLVVRNGVEKVGALASTVVGRKGGSREKEAARWARKGIDISTVADAAPTQEQADKAGPGFLPQLTLRMRARLQGFPDWWDFVGGKDSTARQVGNAVPPVIGHAIGLAVRSALTSKVFDYSIMLRETNGPGESLLREVVDAPSIVPALHRTEMTLA